MITNLFSSFEPSSRIFNIPLNWTSVFIGLLIVPYLYWPSPSRWALLWSKIMNSLHAEFKALLGPSGLGRTMIFIRCFRFIVFNNFLGLFPFIFTGTTHLTTSLSIALPLWLAFFLYGWVKKTQHIFAHLVPRGTPPLLMPLIVLIETVRSIIRPGTLAIRLTANMMAGHLILTLLGIRGPFLSSTLLSFLLFSQILLLMLESAVAVIQSYVFAALRTLYAGEVN